MGKIRIIVKSFLIGMGIYLFFSFQPLFSEKVMASSISIIVLWVMAYLLIFKSDKIVNRCFTELSDESPADEKFTIYCMNIFIFFFSLMALITVGNRLIQNILDALYFSRAAIDSNLYKYMLTNGYSDIGWLQAFSNLPYVLCLTYLLTRPDHFIRLIRKSERQPNVQL